MSDFLQTLQERVLVFDGGFGTGVQERDLGPDDFGGEQYEGCNEYLVLTKPDVIRDLHAGFFEAGSDAVETATFGAFGQVLDDYGLRDETYAINETAARIAREVAGDYATPDRPRWVVGSIGPGTKLPSLGHTSFASLRDDYEVMVDGLLAGGVDVLLVETVYDLLQGKAALLACRRSMARAGREVPLMVQVTIETTGRMLVGSEIGAALTTLEALRPDVIGMNCATGPQEMTEHLRYLSEHARPFLSVLPNAGLPEVVDGRTAYNLTPEALAEAHDRFTAEFGVNIVGGCCGTTPDHLGAVVDAVGDRAPTPREPAHDPGAASVYSHAPFRQETSFLVVGERTNTNGSKQFREHLIDGDWDACLQMARDQTREGAHLLDVCVDYVGRDGVEDMSALMDRFATEVSIPLVIDSTEPEVMEAGLEKIAGKAVLNSANLEEGEEEGQRLDRVLSLARDYGASVICLAIDEEGQARSTDWKFEVCERLYRIATERYGIDPSDLIFDALTFPLSTGDADLRGDGKQTIEAIRRIKAELPGASTVLGVSNVSFGLKPAARHVLNSVFLHECVEAGLDAAIVHAARIVPMHKIDQRVRDIALDLIYDRRRDGYDPLQEFITLFLDVEAEAIEKEDRSGWPVDERLKHRIIDGDRDGLEADLDEALEELSALQIVNDVLLEGMKVVGDLFATGEMQLPFVLQSAETMKAAVAHLEPYMEKLEGGGKGTVVLGTVKGDVHDIGKNLVDIILSNNGYQVHNIGIKVPLQEFVDKVDEVGADAVGMSGLLVKSTVIMRENLEELNDRQLHEVPVLLGGAALNRTYVERDLREVYKGRVFYGKDAFEGLRVVDELMDGKRSGELDPSFGREVTGRDLPRRGERKAKEAADALEFVAEPTVPTDNEIFEPPFLGARFAKGVAIDDIAAYLNETALFRNQWQFRPEGGERDDDLKERVRPILREQIAKAKEEGVLQPAVAWGYFPANSEGNELIVWRDDDRREEWLRFRFPRQIKDERHLSIPDFFRPADGGERDYAAFHVVTIGEDASRHERYLFESDQYQDYLYFHGLSVEMAEALAEYWHLRVRQEWGFADEDGPTLQGLFKQQYRGGRYSWGYPACPDLEDQAKVEELLEMEHIGVRLSDEYQLEPEQSTSAIICHHPDAKYFIAR